MAKRLSIEYRCVRILRLSVSSNFSYSFFSADTEGITVGKFYATFLIQEYFRKFKKKRQDERKKKNADSTVALKVKHFRSLFSGGLEESSFFQLLSCLTFFYFMPCLSFCRSLNSTSQTVHIFF